MFLDHCFQFRPSPAIGDIIIYFCSPFLGFGKLKNSVLFEVRWFGGTFGGLVGIATGDGS